MTISDYSENRESMMALANDADTLDHEREARLTALLDRLEALDPDLVRRVTETLKDRQHAALWFARPNRGLGGISPYRALAHGQRQLVLDAIGRIEQGVFG
ncbi:MAG: MbcA/ParS/Xre antitoxin family protein [Nitrospira sp.]|nr:MbcA/ParS/Xre antitoxin family protein [Nitrospira sp.]